MDNKSAIQLFNTGLATEIFVKYLKRQNYDNETINNFILKAKDIYSKLSRNTQDIGMLVGKVQSGKTTVFSGVIARYFDMGYDLCIILTSTENLLNDQTNERMEKIFRYETPSKIDIFHCDNFILRNSSKRIEKVNDDFKNGHKYIVTILKNKQIEKITEVLANNKLWKNKKILIVDDEADLASTGSSDTEDVRFANNAIKNLLASLKNYNYLSVTATPQAQILISDDDVVKPKHVFTYEPGDGYMGLNEYFNKDSFFQFIDENEWKQKDITALPESLKDAVINYFINISNLILKTGKIINTTMLVHTSTAIEDHFKIMRFLIKYKDSILLFLNQDKSSLDYQILIQKIKTIFDKLQHQNITWDDDYIKLLKMIITHTNINIINSESDDNILENINNIVLGSRKVERGVTLENLLLTYITNFTDGTTAVDTVLQRARWFGYRRKIEDCLNIYMIPSLFKQYKEYIIPSENELWDRLKNAEINDDFHTFEKYISLGGKNAPTHKVKSNRADGEKILFYDSSVERDLEVERNSKSIYLLFNQYDRSFFSLNNRPYSAILNINFLEFCNLIKEQKIYDTIGINQFFWKEIKDKISNLNFMILFLDDAGKNNFRERTAMNGKYQLFEGSHAESGFPGENMLYKFDAMKNMVVVCLHKIRDKDDNKLRYYISLHLPKENEFVGKFFVNN
ncbi:MAG: Z1 domain-containing protein [Mycoplasma sp.]